MTVSSSTLPASVSLCSNGLFPTRSLPSYFAAASRPPPPPPVSLSFPVSGTLLFDSSGREGRRRHLNTASCGYMCVPFWGHPCQRLWGRCFAKPVTSLPAKGQLPLLRDPLSWLLEMRSPSPLPDCEQLTTTWGPLFLMLKCWKQRPGAPNELYPEPEWQPRCPDFQGSLTLLPCGQIWGEMEQFLAFTLQAE